MSRIVPVIKREFTEAVGTKAFIIGTILGPLLIFALFGLQFLVLAKSGGGEQRITIVDSSGLDIGAEVASRVQEGNPNLPSFISRATYSVRVEEVAPEKKAEVFAANTGAVVAKAMDGFLWIPPDVLTSGTVQYEGSNATNTQVTNELQRAVQRVVHSQRLREAGIDEAQLGGALATIEMTVVKTGDKGQSGSPQTAMALAGLMAFAIYIVVLMYGQSIMSSVQEEKRDRVVELIVSSIRARDLLIGKVIGIGAAGVLQMGIWVLAATLLLTQGAVIAAAVGANEDVVARFAEGGLLPTVSPVVGIAFLLYFTGGFFLFATLFGIIGALVTDAKEAQQFVFPVLMPFIIGLFIAMSAMENPNSPVAFIGSLVPFTSPMVMPVRISVAGVNWLEFAASIVILYGSATVIIWFAAKIYRTAIFATGQKPTFSEVVRWMRAA